MQSPNRNRSTLLQAGITLAVLAILVVVVIVVINLYPHDPGGDRSVTFRVESSGGYALITLDAASQKISGNQTVTTPWEKTVKVPAGEEVYFTASNPNQTGSLSCSIKINKKAWKQSKIDAPKDGVACAGIVP